MTFCAKLDCSPKSLPSVPFTPRNFCRYGSVVVTKVGRFAEVMPCSSASKVAYTTHVNAACQRGSSCDTNPASGDLSNASGRIWKAPGLLALPRQPAKADLSVTIASQRPEFSASNSLFV